MTTFIFLWVVGVIVLLFDYKSQALRWYSAISFFLGGLYGFHFLILEKMNFWLAKYPVVLLLETRLIYGLPIILFPYTFLMSCIFYYTDLLKQRLKWGKPLALILLLPVVASGIMLFGFSDFNHPRLHLFNSLWVIPYILVGNFLLINTYLRARSQLERNNSFVNCILITPITILNLIVIFILPIFDIQLNLNPFLNIVLFISFSCVVTRYGFLGRKLQIQKLSLDNSIKSMTSGAAILNHSIKNEIAKIAICASNLKAVGLNPTQIKESARIMLHSTGHILGMIERIKECTHDFILCKTAVNLKAFCEGLLAEFQYQFLDKKIEVTTSINPEIWLSVDELHLGEVINNLLRNGIEAMDSGGKLELKVVQSRATVTIIIKDTGVGIPHDILHHIGEPFFTTKDPKKNFGLGLLYCYQVLKKHGGRMEIESEPNKGTTLYLNFPSNNRKRFCSRKGAIAQ